jgi:cyclopropane fatty-acyl-phospholipid synthase-like methyltransferase
MPMDHKLDKEKIDQYWKSRTLISDSVTSVRHRDDDRVKYDLSLIEKFADKDSKVLDLAAGTGLLTVPLSARVKCVTAVDKYVDFLKKIPTDLNITTIACDINDFDFNEKYDLILAFGIFNYLNAEDLSAILWKVKKSLTVKGKFIIKHQSGINGEIQVNQWSEQLAAPYVAVYRHQVDEIALYKKYFKSVDVVDLYPKELNPWPNTHHFGYICSD